MLPPWTLREGKWRGYARCEERNWRQQPTGAAAGRRGRAGERADGDYGFGPLLVHHLQAHSIFPEGVTVADLGTPGLDLAPFLEDTSAVMIIDTIRVPDPLGRLRCYRREELLAARLGQRLPPHHPGVVQALQMLESPGSGRKEVLLVWGAPFSRSLGPGLSNAVRAAVEPAAATVVERLGALGFRLRRREEALALEVWWERPVHEAMGEG